MKTKQNIFIISALTILVCACGNKSMTNNQQSSETQTYTQASPQFDADSAYHFVKSQVDFGPRVPNTKEHMTCGDYLVNELKRFGAEVTEQKADLEAYNKTILKARNIIGTFGKEKENRVLLFAHWDTRPFADNDPNPKNNHTPILGANDGASGVGVLLEIARIIQSKSPEVGVDIIFFDAEDYGVPSFERTFFDTSDTWCLGSQYWSKNPHTPNYKARFGILLDMVGAPDAKFYKEYFSKKYAGTTLTKTWTAARNLGYGKYFIDADGGMITDDHLPVNQIRNIPSIDIIQYDKDSDTGFGWYWHTIKDDMSNISKETLKAVGQTVLEVVYNEK